MLTFTSPGGSSVRITGGPQPILAFPGNKQTEKNGLTLFAMPDEEPVPGTISWPGEYNEGGVSVRGIGHHDGQQSSYVLELDGVRVALLSSPLQDWSDPQLEMVGDIDVLVLPADEVKLVQKLVDEFDPRVLILTPSKDLSEVTKTIGAKETTSEYKLKGSLPAEGREVVVLAE